MRLQEIINDDTLVGPRWHQSLEKRQFDAEVGSALRKIVQPIALLTSQTLYHHYGYQLFGSVRDTGEYNPDGDPIEVSILKTQTLYATDIPWRPGVQEVIPMLPVAWLARYFMLDQLIELEHVSTDPERPGPLSLIGPRYLVHGERVHMRQMSLEHGEQDTFRAWDSCYRTMPKGVLDLASNLPDECEQGSMEFYRERMHRHIWWFENASPKLDLEILKRIVEIGVRRIENIKEAVEPQIAIWHAIAELEHQPQQTRGDC